MKDLELKLEEFSGPLDLLLSLIQEQKLSITELSLSRVTEQYLDYIDKLEKYHPEELADFLVIATRLLLLKSQALIPQFAPEEEDGPSLEEQLRLYKMFVGASKKLNEKWVSNLRGSFRIEPPRKTEGFVWPANVSLDAMQQSMVQLLSRLKPPEALPQTQIDKAISMKERIDSIRKQLKKSGEVGFHEMLKSAKNKTEVIVSFLAILELVKQQTIYLQQDDTFSDILIRKV